MVAGSVQYGGVVVGSMQYGGVVAGSVQYGGVVAGSMQYGGVVAGCVQYGGVIAEQLEFIKIFLHIYVLQISMESCNLSVKEWRCSPKCVVMVKGAYPSQHFLTAGLDAQVQHLLLELL